MLACSSLSECNAWQEVELQQTAVRDKHNPQLLPAPWLSSCSCAAIPDPCPFSCGSLCTCSWQQLDPAACLSDILTSSLLIHSWLDQTCNWIVICSAL